MNRKGLARALAQKTGMTLRQAENVVIAFGAVITNVLSEGKKAVYSNFGTFYIVHYPSKTIKHPRLGAKKTMIMLPTNAGKWMPADNIKKMVNSGKLVGSPTRHKSKKIADETKKETSTDQPITSQPFNKSTQPSEDDDLEKYLAEKKKEGEREPVNVYDEILKDGSHEFSTVKGAIKAHHEEKPRGNADGPFASIKEKLGFGPKKEEDKEENKDGNKDIDKGEDQDKEPKEKVSLADAGIFGKESTVATAPPHLESRGEQKIKEIKAEVGEVPPTPPQAEEAKEDKKDKTDQAIIKSAIPDKINIQYQDLSKIAVAKELLAKIPENIARRYKAVPIEEKDEKIFVAMADPEDIEAKEIFKKLLGKDITIRLATEEDINHVLSQYQGLESEVTSAIKSVEEEEKGDEEKKKEEKQKVQAEAASDDAPAARIVSSLLKRAIRDKASDVHIEPSELNVEVRFRLDGVLRKKVSLPKEIQAAVISRIKILSNLKIDEQRVPQDGRFNLTVDNRKVDFRVSTMPTAFGEKVVMRILDKESGILTVEQLGIRGSGKKVLEDNITKNHGMILVTGPTGSGKTTTLYAIVQKIFSEGVNIVTLEDPIEYQIKGINQSQVNSEIGYTFANGLRSILRQDPDVIMLGEIRDKETAEMAVHAALTGHVVISTLHTNDSSGAVPRLIDMGVEPFLLTSSINVVVGQRLVRTLCPDCKEEAKLTQEELSAIKAEINKMPAKEKSEVEKKTLKFFHGKGCKSCDQSGYQGRIGIYEVLNVTEPIKELILKRVPASQIEERAIAEGILTMMQDGILKAIEGITSTEEIWRVTKE